MLLQLKEFIREKRNKPFSFVVNCVGMSLAFTALIILFTYVRAELNHDKDVVDRADIVRMKNASWGITPGAYASWLAGNLPEVKQYCRVLEMSMAIFVPQQGEIGEQYVEENVVLADSTYPEFFSLRLLAGNLKDALVTTEQVILSESMARQLFGESDPLGKQLVLGGAIHSTVVAVYKDINNPGLRRPKMITNLNYVDKAWQAGYSDSWWSSNWETYFKLTPGVDRAQLTEKYRQLYAQKLKSFGWEDANIQDELPQAKFSEFNELYFTPEVDFAQHGNRANINILILIAVLVLGVSIINYVNMATARLADKARIIGVKRTLGAGRRRLISSIILDSVVTCFLAMVIAWILAEISFPYLSDWLGCGDVLNIDKWTGIILFILIPLLSGLLSGIFPSVYLTQMNRLDSMNSQRNESIALQRVKGGLMVLQFAVSIGLIIATLLINKQVEYIKHLDPGYDRTDVVVVKGHGEAVLLEKFPEFRNLLLQNPSIVKVAAAKEPIYNIGERGGHLRVPGSGEEIGGAVTWIDENFMDLMGLKLIEGEEFQERTKNRGKFIINQRMAKRIAAESPDHSYLSERQIGVVKDFNFKSMHQPIEPMYFGYINDYQQMADAYIRIAPEDRKATLDYIEKCYRQIYPQTFYQYSFMDDDYAGLYGSEDLFAKRLLAFTAMAIVIACLGLLAFVAFFIEQKTKSIGVRKVMGATEYQIMELLNRDFIRRLFIAFLIACPVVYYMIHLWLGNFAYKTSLSWWIFVLAFVIMIVIALLTVSVLTWKAATRNPVDSLKTE
ncbi:ABC transporter permease [Odoribacter laneus]|uniref:ABC transporter permease n=1 Tax=Odoribacter laneus TaxID=626933 RepID=UPI0039959264